MIIYFIELRHYFHSTFQMAQAFSNNISIRLIGKPIHGRFDIEDIRYNTKGLFFGPIILLLKLNGKN